MKPLFTLVIICLISLPLKWGLLRDSAGDFHLIDKGFLGRGPLYRDLSGVASAEIAVALASRGAPFQTHWDAWAGQACTKRVAVWDAEARRAIRMMPLALAVKAGPVSETLPQIIPLISEIEGGKFCPSGGTFVYTGGENGSVACDLHRERGLGMKAEQQR